MAEERETPKPRRARWGRRLWRAFRIAYAVFFLLFTAFLLWLFRTNAGARFAVSQLGILMHGSFAVQKATGTLASPLHLEGLTYRTDTMTATARSVDLTWHLGALLRRKLDIVSLRADGVRVATKPSKEKAPLKLPDLHLPVNVAVHEARVTDLVIAGGGGKPDFPISSITLATTTFPRNEALRVDRLAVRAPTMSADVSGTVRPQGDYPVDLKLSWTYLVEKTTYRGSGRLTGTMKKLHVVHALEAPARIGSDVVVTDPFEKQELDGTITLERVALRAFKPDAPDVTLDGRVNVKGTVPKLRASGALTALSPMFARADAAFDLTRDGETVRIAKLDLQLPKTRTTASARGVVTLGKAPAGSVEVAWTNVVWPLAGKPTVRSPKGSVRAKGSMADWNVNLEAALLVPQLKDGATLTADARGNERSATFRTFTAGLLGGKITGSGAATFRPDVSWNLTLDGSGLDPAQFAPKLAGAVGFHATTKGTNKGGLSFTLAVADLSGTLERQQLSGHFEASVARGETDIRSLDVTLGGATARAHGHVGRRLDVTFEAGVKNLGLFVPQAQGALAVRGHATGTRDAPRIVAKADARGLVYAGKEAGKLSLDADVDLARGGKMRVDLSGSRLKLVGNRFIDTATLALHGTREAHTLSITTTTETGRLDARLAGGLERRGKSFAWRGTLDRLDAQSRPAGNWTLASPARLDASAAAADLSGFCWVQQGARLCADASWRKDGPMRADVTLTQIPLGLFSQFAPGDVRLAGRLDGKIKAEGDAHALTVSTRLAVSGATLTYAGAGGREGVTHVSNATLNADLGGRGLAMNLDVALDGGTIHVEAEAPPGGPRGLPGKTSPLRGTVRADLRDLSFLKAVDEDLGRVEGRIAADIRIGGTYGSPQAFGSATFDVPRADLPDEGLSVRDIHVALRANGTAATLEGSLKSGSGTLTMDGSTAFAANAVTRLHVRGSRVTASWTEENKLLVSPDLTLTLKGSQVDATGTVEVPWSRLNYRKKVSTVSVSKDVRYVGGPPDEPEKGRQVRARLRVVLGEDMQFSGMGLSAQLQGSLLLVENPGEAPTGTGELDVVKGTYTAYGQNLTVERGRLLFAGGPLDDPGIDARASRTAKDGVVAGLNIAGTLKEPRITLFSQPPMGDADILAYIVLGHPLGQSTPQEGNLVANAATSLGIKGANLLGKKIAARFGLEEVKIKTGDTLQEASLVVGKYLSPRLFVSYGIGLFDRVSTITIDYHVTQHWTLRATVGDGNAGDVLYTIGGGSSAFAGAAPIGAATAPGGAH